MSKEIKTSKRIEQVSEYYFSSKMREINKMILEGHKVINLGIGKPDMMPPKAVIESLREDSLKENAHGYQSYKGIPELRHAIADFYQVNYGCQVQADTQILPLKGSKEGIMLIAMAFIDRGDNVLVPNPGYPSYAGACQIAEAEIRSYNLTEETNWQINMDEIRALSDDRTKIMFLNYPHMPTGAKADMDILAELVIWSREQGVLLVFDNPYGFILNDNPQSILSIPGAIETCVELNSMSKSFAMSGWRVGMLLGDEKWINAVLQVQSNMDSGMFRPIQVAAAFALQQKTNWFEKNNIIYNQRREKIYRLLDEIDFTYQRDAAGLFVWSKVSSKFKNGREASDFFLQKSHVFVPPGEIFGTQGDAYVRWSLCENEYTIDEAKRRIVTRLKF